MFKIDLFGHSDLFHGIHHLQKTADGVIPVRLSEKLQEYYQRKSADWFRYSRGSAGVTLQFCTTAAKMTLQVKLNSFARPYFGFDVLCGGTLIKRVTENSEMETYSFSADLPGKGLRHITVAFPWQSECDITGLFLDDASVVEPITYSGQPLLMLGDSITQGFEVSYPGESYAARVAAARGGEWFNLAVGGTVMDSETVAGAMEYPWSTVILAFGVNDSSKKIPLEKFRTETMKSLTLLSSRKEAEIFVFTPLPWHGCPSDHPEEFALGKYRDILKECAAKFPQVRCIDGPTLLDDRDEYFADAVHPCAAGMKMIAQRAIPLLGFVQ